MNRDQQPQRDGVITAERPAENVADASAASEPPAHVQFKSGGDIPAVGGSFRATTSDTDAAYEPAAPLGADAQPGQNVQFIRGAMRGPTVRQRLNPTTGAIEVWSDSEHKWLPRVDGADGSGGFHGSGG